MKQQLFDLKWVNFHVSRGDLLLIKENVRIRNAEFCLYRFRIVKDPLFCAILTALYGHWQNASMRSSQPILPEQC